MRFNTLGSSSVLGGSFARRGMERAGWQWQPAPHDPSNIISLDQNAYSVSVMMAATATVAAAAGFVFDEEVDLGSTGFLGPTHIDHASVVVDAVKTIFGDFAMAGSGSVDAAADQVLVGSITIAGNASLSSSSLMAMIATVAMNGAASLSLDSLMAMVSAITLAASATLGIDPNALISEDVVIEATASTQVQGALGDIFDEAFVMAATGALDLTELQTLIGVLSLNAAAAIAVVSQGALGGSITVAGTAAAVASSQQALSDSVALSGTAAVALAASKSFIDSIAMVCNSAFGSRIDLVDGSLSFVSTATMQLRGYIGLVPAEIIFDGVNLARTRLKAQAVGSPRLADVQLVSPSLLNVTLQET